MKKFRKALSILLCLMMLMSTCSVILASAAEYDHLPQIYVQGIGSRKVYDKTDPDHTSLFYPVDSEGLVENLKKFPEYAKEAIKNLDPDLMYNCAYNWIWDTMGKAALDTDGMTSKDKNVVIDPCDLDVDEAQGKYWFNYDSRLDPVDLAKQLHDYIELVKEHSGSDKFELVGSSYGTSVIMAFINEYPEEMAQFDSVLLCVPSYAGVDFVGELFSGQLTVDPQTLEDFVDVMVGNDDINLILDILGKSGALSAITEAALEPVLYAALMDAVRDLARDLFGTFPSMWSFVQDEYFYAALENIYGENYNDPDHEYAKLIEKITYYHENVMVRPHELFDLAEKKGATMNIISKYGRPSLPLSEHGNFMSDGLVDLEDATMGATCSMYRETLPANYTQAKHTDYNMISLDRCVDASTGIRPFNTWYIKGLEHGEKIDSYFNMINYIVYNNVDVTTENSPYPQFLERVGDDIVPLGEGEEKKATTMIEDLIRLLKRIIELLFGKLTEIFKK